MIRRHIKIPKCEITRFYRDTGDLKTYNVILECDYDDEDKIM